MTAWLRASFYVSPAPHRPVHPDLPDGGQRYGPRAPEEDRRHCRNSGAPSHPAALRRGAGSARRLPLGPAPEALNNDGLEAGFLGKGRGTVVRLAAALALFAGRRPEKYTVPTSSTWTGCEMPLAYDDYFRPHARAVFDQAGATGRDRHLRKTIRWLRSSRTEELSREDVRCVALGRAVDAEGADRVIARLVAGHVLREVRSGSGGRRGRPALRWLVNRSLFQTGDADA